MIEEIDMSTYRPRTRMILGIGDSGTGKTHFIGTMPKPLIVFSFDQGFDTIAMRPGIKVVSIQEKDRKSPKAWQEFKARFAKFLGGETYNGEKYKSIALDGVTFLSEYCMNYYQFMGSNVDKKATFTQYQQLLENMSDVFNDCKRTTEFVCCTALTKVDKDELTGEIMTLPNLTGSIRDQLAAKFDAVFFFYSERKTNGTEVYSIKTVSGYREKGKIRLPSDMRGVIAPVVENPNFEQLLKLIESKIELVYGSLPKPPETSQAPEVETAPSNSSPEPQAQGQESGPIPPRPSAVVKAAPASSTGGLVSPAQSVKPALKPVSPRPAAPITNPGKSAGVGQVAKPVVRIQPRVR